MGFTDGIYGLDIVNAILKEFAKVIKKSVRDIDFVFRNDYIFKILTFNNLEITDKIVTRLKNSLDLIECNGVKPSFNIVFSHIPELENNILSAIDFCEKKLIERD